MKQTPTSNKISYERLATLFLNTFGFVIHADRKDDECPPWCDGNHDHGKHYVVFVMDKAKERELSFDFWESDKDQAEDGRPTNYTILSIIKATIDADPYNADRFTLQKIQEFTDKAKNFFKPEELEKLEELF